MRISLLYDELAAPARCALQALGLVEIEDLSKFSRESVSELHGIGPAAMAAIEKRMRSLKVSFSARKRAAGASGAAVVSEIDGYIGQFPEATQARLREIRAAIRSIAPEATEKIAYGMPTFYLTGNLVHFAGYKHHIGFYPTPSGIEGFKEELDAYKNAKGSVQFPLDRPLPIDLIKRIVKYRLGEMTKKASRAKKKS